VERCESGKVKRWKGGKVGRRKVESRESEGGTLGMWDGGRWKGRKVEREIG
jgi:hypothetical protein